ncbi:MAG: type II toxin-antitoxin system RelE/ParE family toxin [Bacteroides sp.]|nr:type II toxin-antitoxin system RelE/ParE family toxin [Bacteroides sp.]
MVKKNLPVRWSPKAKQRLDDIYNYIAADSISAAKHVKRTLSQIAKSLGNFPEKFSKEEYMANEPGNYRSVSKWRYKIIYEVTDKYVVIINVFNTSQHPSKIRIAKDS